MSIIMINMLIVLCDFVTLIDMRGAKIMIVNKLSEVMGRNRLKISDVIEMTGLARNTVAELYHGRAKRVDFETLDKLCNALKCPLDDIISHNAQETEDIGGS
jgi:putative transcriptional regulator